MHAKESQQDHGSTIRKHLLSWDRRHKILGPCERSKGLRIKQAGLQEGAVAECIFRLKSCSLTVPLLAEHRRKAAEEKWEMSPDGSVCL